VLVMAVQGFVDGSLGENLMSGCVRVHGNFSECAGASVELGAVVKGKNASARVGI
jgi:methylamine---glutamate N-methyltransferase subunit B